MVTKVKKAHSVHGSHTTSMTKKVLGLLVVVCVLVGAFVFIPKNPGNLSSQTLPNTTESATTSSECPDASVKVEWNPNPESNIAGYKIFISGPNGETIITVGKVTTYGPIILTAAPNPGIEYTFTLTAFNTAGLESARSVPVIYKATCADDGEEIIVPPGNPPYPKPTHLMCDYTEKDCKPVDGAASPSDAPCVDANCQCYPPQVMGDVTVYSVEISYDNSSWSEYIPADVGPDYDNDDLMAELENIANGDNPPARAFLRIKSETTQDCIDPPSSLGSSVFGGGNTPVSAGPSLWSRFMTFVTSLFSSSSSLSSEALSTVPPSQPGSYKNVEVAIKNLGEGNKVIMSGDVGGLTIQNTSPFKASFPQGTKLSFTAVTGPHSTFTGWTGGCTTIVGKTCSFTVQDEHSIAAAFDYEKVTLSASLSPTATGLGVITSSYKDIECGAGKLKCTTEYAYNTFEVLTATPALGSSFASWQGCDKVVGNKCLLLMDSNKTATATFSKPINGVCSTATNTCTVGTFVDVADTTTQYKWSCTGQYGGTTSICSANKPINGVCGTTNNSCTTGTLVDVADTTTQYKWSCTGINGGTTSACSLNKPVVVYKLTATKVGPGTILKGTSSFSGGVFPLGTTVILTAVPATGYRFTSWTGCSAVSGNKCTVYINTNKTVTATFKL